MTMEEFKRSLKDMHPPADTSVYLQALWLEAAGKWAQAHHLVDQLETEQAYWVHAYLHRREGDLGNAHYWYRRAGRKMQDIAPEREWEQLVGYLLG